MDLLITAVCVGAWSTLAKCGWAPWALTAVPPDTRRALYQVLATIAATMGGVTLTSISLLLNLLQIPMSATDRVLAGGDKRRVGEAFLGVLPWLTVLFVGSLVALTVDATLGSGYWLLQLALLGLAVVAVCSIGRVVWILRRLLAAVAEGRPVIDGHSTATAADSAV